MRASRSLVAGALFAGAVTLVMAVFGLAAGAAAQSSSRTVFLPFVSHSSFCFIWQDQIPLQRAVEQHACVEMQSGVWSTTLQIAMPAGHVLRGVDRETTIVRAVEPWVGNNVTQHEEAVVHDNGQSGVVLVNFTIDANRLATFGVGAHGSGTRISNLHILNSICDGVAIAGYGWQVTDSLIEYAGNSCWSGVPAAGIYVVGANDDRPPAVDLAPRIERNVIRNNNGPGLDVKQVSGGVFRGNTVEDNAAWAAITLYGADRWLIEDNVVRHPFVGDGEHPGHPSCTGGPFGVHPAAISVCTDERTDATATGNVIRRNHVSSWYGLRLIGADEELAAHLPRANQLEDNTVLGSQVGCIDDAAPSEFIDGLNRWRNNDCDGTADSLPIYFEVLCPSAVRRARLADWQQGEADAVQVQARIDEFNAHRTGGGDFGVGAQLPTGMVVATDFGGAGRNWQEFPVQPLAYNGNWGLFETLQGYTAPYPGACLTIHPAE